MCFLVQLFLNLTVLDVDAQLSFDLGDLVDAPLMPAAGERGFEPCFQYLPCYRSTPP